MLHVVKSEQPEEDAIPENVSFDTYELDNTGNETDPQLEPISGQIQVDDPDATDPSLGPEAADHAASINTPGDEIELDSFDLELPEEDVLSEDDELDLTALEDLKEQVSVDSPTGVTAAPIEAESFDIGDDPEPETDALPDGPQEKQEEAPILDFKHPAAPAVPLPPPGELASAADKSEELQFEETDAVFVAEDAEEKTDVKLESAAESQSNSLAEDTLPHEVVSVKPSLGKKNALSSTLRELENLNLKMPRPKTTKIHKSPTSSVDDLLTGLVTSSSKKKSKTQKVHIKVPNTFNQAQLNCIFLDDRQNVIHTHLAKIEPEEVGDGKYQIKLTLDIEVDS